MGWDVKTLKNVTKLQDTDLLYASFVSEVRVQPYTFMYTYINVHVYMYIYYMMKA